MSNRFQKYLEAASDKKAIINGKEFPCRESGMNFMFSRSIVQDVAKEVVKTKKFKADEGRRGYDFIMKLASDGPEASDNKGSIPYKIDSFGIPKYYFDNGADKDTRTPEEKEKQHTKDLTDLYTPKPGKKTPHWTGD